MKRKALRKNTIREIKGSFGRYIAILAIVALGVGFFSGLKVTKEAMIATGDEYFRENALYDLRLISSLGLSDDDAKEIGKLDFVRDAEGAYSMDVLLQRGSKTVSAAKLMSISDRINKVILTEGRMPEAPNECLGDSDWFSPSSIGEKITIPDSNSESALNALAYTEFTVVGLCRSPLYVHFERGNTSLGNGKLSGFVCLPAEAFKSSYYTDIYVLTDAGNEEIYSDAYNDLMDSETPVAEKKLEELANDRYEELKSVYGPFVPKPDTYVLTRNVNIGYASFENDSSIVEGIGNVFPIFFFLVAALVCMTTMNRMVEEKRTEIGVMKALGYSEGLIMGKFLFYSGSAAIVGAVSGFLVGSKIFPYVIWHAYGILYTMREIIFVINPVLAAVSMVVAVICSMGATYVTLRNELRSNAADLIRPKAPASGKRVFLEKITFIWKRLKFTDKVSVRNVFRYHKRLWMMILGVGGCYGLLITGLGIRDSIADVCDRQFIDIQKYDMTVSFKGEGGDRSDFEALIKDEKDFIYSLTKTVDVVSGNKVKSATMVVFDNGVNNRNGSDFINFTDSDGHGLSLPKKDEAILTEKMADLLGVSEGDEVILRDTDLNEITVTVSGVMKNYVYNWVYIDPETYKEARGEEPKFNTAYVKTEEDGYALGAKVNALDYVSSVSLTEEMSKRISSMMDSLNQVVWLVIASAAALAFIVMYNLTNINITERLREIATLKVLGFYSGETAVYVFRENMILTAFGIVAGLFMGFGLHRYVMYNINVEVVTFDTKILPISYVYGVLLTFAFALFVDLVLSFKLEKIKMAESLKSVE